MYKSTKTIGPISTSHRNWRARYNENRNSQHCSFIHGYSRYIKFTFEGDLDEHGWVYDFGDTKFIKEWLEKNWDHKVLIASDDPDLEFIKQMHNKNIISINILDVTRGHGPGIECSGKHVFDNIQPVITEKTKGRVRIQEIEIWEHEGNSASYIPSEDDFDLIGTKE